MCTVIIGISARYVEEHADNNQILVQQVPDMKMMLRVYKQLYSMIDNLPRMDKLWMQAQTLWNELVTGNSPIKIKPWIPTIAAWTGVKSETLFTVLTLLHDVMGRQEL